MWVSGGPTECLPPAQPALPVGTPARPASQLAKPRGLILYLHEMSPLPGAGGGPLMALKGSQLVHLSS